MRSLTRLQSLSRSNNHWIGVGGLVHINGAGLQRIEIGAVRIIAVANPNHPLAQAGHAAGLHSQLNEPTISISRMPCDIYWPLLPLSIQSKLELAPVV